MKKLNNEAYKALLKSVNPGYEKEALWTDIESQLDKKKKRRFLWIFFFGIGVLIPLAWVTVNWSPAGSEIQQESLVEKVEKQLVVTERDVMNQEIKNEASSQTKSHNSENIINSFDAHTFNEVEFTFKSDQKNKTKSYKDIGSTLPEESTFRKDAVPRNQDRQDWKPSDFVTRSESKISSGHFVIDTVQPVAYRRNKIAEIDKLPYSLTLPLELIHSRVLIYQPSVIEVRRTQPYPILHFFALRMDLSQPKSSFANKSDLEENWMHLLRSTNTDYYHAGIGARYKVRLKSGLELKAGLQIDRYVSRFNHMVSSTRIDTVPSEVAYVFVYDDGTKENFPGLIEQQTTEDRSIQHYNHEHRVGLSLGLGYDLYLGGRFSLRPEINGYFFPITFSDGKSLSQSLSVVTDLIDHNKDLVQLEVGGDLGYYTRPGMELFIGAHYRRDLNSTWASPLMKKKSRIYGLHLGVRGQLR